MTNSFDGSLDQATALVAAHCDEDIQSLRAERIATGHFNTSYRVIGHKGRYILRVAPPDDAGFLFYERGMMAQEPEIHARVLCETNLPVAPILVYDNSRTRIDRDYLIMVGLPGVALSEVSDLRAADLARILSELGQYLSQLHALTADRYGYLGAHQCMEPQRTWREAFGVMWHLLLDDIGRCGGYSADECKKMSRLFSAHAGRFEHEVAPSLLHMDIWGQNILVNEQGRITGILDFDRALYGDPEIEFAVLDYCGLSSPAFWVGYGRPRPAGTDALVRQKFYLLYEVQKYIVIERLRRKNPKQADQYRTMSLRLARRIQDP